MNSTGPNLFRILQAHIDIMSYSSGYPFIPFVPKKLMLELLNAASMALLKDPNIIELDTNTVVVGDIHGHLFDIYNIIKNYELPPARNYLFLGDIVDRGRYSVECMTLVFLLKIFYPKHVFILRGNHEFENETTPNLKEQCYDLYRSGEVYTAFQSAFAYLPIAAKIGPILCLHGGLDPSIVSLNQINNFRRPLYSMPKELEGIFWSDPNQMLKVDYSLSNYRNKGYEFNENALVTFMKNNEISLLIRGHQFVQEGYEVLMKGKLLTLFSASYYIE